MDPAMMAMLVQMAQQQQQNNVAMGQAAGSGGDFFGALAQSPLGMNPLVSIGGGFLSGRKAKKKQKKLKKRIEAQRRATEAITGRALSQQEALARQATQQRLGGFDKAQQAAQLAAQGAKRGVMERGQQAQASLTQDLANRGLGSTSVGANLGRGISADTTRALGGIDEALGQYFGNLAMGRAGVEAGGTESLADLSAQRANFDVQNANFWSPYNWQQLGGADTRLAGMQQPQMQPLDFSWMGGGGGSAGGAKTGTQFNNQALNLANLAGLFGA